MTRCFIVVGLLLGSGIWASAQEAVSKPYFGIRVVDEATGRGVPLIELRTTNDIALITDSSGWIALDEPGLMDRQVYFGVSGPGYEHAADGFGYRGVRLTTTPGKSAAVKVKRTNIAERLYRVTGQGIYADTEKLGLPIPRGQANMNAGVMGQDSVQAVPYRGKVFWLWGDTTQPAYPLGNFHTTSATSPLPGAEFKPSEGVPLEYFIDDDHPDRVRKMMPSSEPGVVWMFGLLTVNDDDGREMLVSHYSRRKGLGGEMEQGLARFNDEAGIFERLAKFDLDNTWRHPRGNAVRVTNDDSDYFYFVEQFAQTRVKADLASLQDPERYEAFTLDESTGDDRWQKDIAPTTQQDEQKLLKRGKLKESSARYQLVDADSSEPVRYIHRASINYNPYRRRWIMIALQQDPEAKPSHLGEVWYAEADEITGPWRKAVKIASHPHYSFYNPRQHVFCDEADGRFIYFEGTYTKTFSGNPTSTPRYEYNQLMYRLDLADERLQSRQKSEVRRALFPNSTGKEASRVGFVD